MSASSARFTILFRAVGSESLNRVRSVIRGVEQQSYTSFNAFNRNMSSMERQTTRSLNAIDRRVKGLHISFRTLSLGLAGFGAGIAFGGLFTGLNTLHRVFIQTNSQMQTSKILIEELLGSKGGATDFVNVMKNMSASFGADIAETMNSSRGLMQVMKQIGNGDVAPKHLDKMLKMVMAVSAMDIENRGLSYTAFSFKEAFQGLGQGDFRSLRNRLEINLGKPVEKAITKALKSGDLDQAITLFDNGLKKIGINSEKLLQRLNKEGFTQNISRLSSYLTRGFQMIGEKSFLSLTEPFYRLNTFLSRQFEKGGVGGEVFGEMGASLYSALSPAISSIMEFGESAYRMRTQIVENFRIMLSSGIEMGKSFYGMFLSFGKGLFGISDSPISDKVGDMVKMMKALSLFADKTSNIFNKLSPVLKFMGKAIHDLISELSGFLGGSGGLAGGVIGGAGYLAGGIVNGITGILATINRIIGNKTFTNPLNPDQQLQSPTSGSMLQDATNYAIIAGVAYPIYNALRRGRGGSAGASSGSASVATATEAEILAGRMRNPSKIALGEKAGQNQMRINSLENELKVAYKDKQFIGANKNKLEESRAVSEMSASKIEQINQKITEAQKLPAHQQNYNINRGRELIAIEEANLAKQIEIQQKLQNKISRGESYETKLSERASLVKQNKYINERAESIVPEKTTMQKIKDNFNMDNAVGGAVIFASLSPIVGKIWSKLAPFIKNILSGSTAMNLLKVATVALISPFGLLAGAIGLVTYLLGDWAIWFEDQKTKRNEEKIKEETANTAMLNREKFNNFMSKHNLSASGIKNFYEKGMNGQAPNSGQLAAILGGAGGKSINFGGRSSAEERHAFNLLSNALKSGVLPKSVANTDLGETAVTALTTDAKVIMDAAITVTGYNSKATKQMEDMIGRAFVKNMKKNSGITGDVDILSMGNIEGTVSGATNVESGNSDFSSTP